MSPIRYQILGRRGQGRRTKSNRRSRVRVRTIGREVSQHSSGGSELGQGTTPDVASLLVGVLDRRDALGVLIAHRGDRLRRGRTRPRSTSRTPPSRGRSTSAPRRRRSAAVPTRRGGDVLKLDYTLPPGTAAGVWSKAFPERLNAGNVDVVRLGVKAADPDPARGDRGRGGDQGDGGRPADPPGPPARLDARRGARRLADDRHAERGRRPRQPRRRRRDRGRRRSTSTSGSSGSPGSGSSARTSRRGSAASSWSACSRRCWRPCCAGRPADRPVEADSARRPRPAGRCRRDLVQGAGSSSSPAWRSASTRWARGGRWRSAGRRWAWRSPARRSPSGGNSGSPAST